MKRSKKRDRTPVKEQASPRNKWRWAAGGAVAGTLVGILSSGSIAMRQTDQRTLGYLIGYLAGSAAVAAFIGLCIGALRERGTRSHFGRGPREPG